MQRAKLARKKTQGKHKGTVLLCCLVRRVGEKLCREKARVKSSTGIYHIIMRGINRQIIFEDTEDYIQFLESLTRQKEMSQIEIYAYCLMSNHVHLLIKEGNEDLGTVFKRIGSSYVYWYNWKYNRRGHLFQDRYISEVVEDDSYLLSVIRYIHHNPLKAGITRALPEYRWCSYNEYTNRKDICNIETGLGIFSDDTQKAIELFKAFSADTIDTNVLDYDDHIRWKDSEAKAFIKEIASVQNPLKYRALIRNCEMS